MGIGSSRAVQNNQCDRNCTEQLSTAIQSATNERGGIYSAPCKYASDARLENKCNEVVCTVAVCATAATACEKI